MRYVVNVPFGEEEDRQNLTPLPMFLVFFHGDIQTIRLPRRNVFGQVVRDSAAISSSSSEADESQSTTPTSRTSNSPIPVPAPRISLQYQATIRDAFNQRVQLIAQAGQELDSVLTAVAHQAAQLGSLPLYVGSGDGPSLTPEPEVGREDGEESEEEYPDSAFI